jgi:hypothetical protein
MHTHFNTETIDECPASRSSRFNPSERAADTVLDWLQTGSGSCENFACLLGRHTVSLVITQTVIK